VLVRDDLGFGSTSFLLGLALTPTVLWRRLHPFAMTALGFGATAASELVGRFADWQEPEQNALVFLLLLPHALFRWGSGREALLGLPVIALSATLGFAGDDQQLGEVLGGLGILSAPIAIGVAGRYRDRARAQDSTWRASCTTRWRTTCRRSPCARKPASPRRREIPKPPSTRCA
jgi:hypothetical protein